MSLLLAAGSSGTTGVITATQGANTASLSGSVTIPSVSGAITATQAGNTASLTGVQRFSGSITALQSDNTASLTGSVSVPVIGTITAQQDSNTAQLTGSGGSASYTAEVELKPRKWYVKRRNQLYLFDSAEEADAFVQADEAAEKAIKDAKKSSKQARKRVRQKVYEVNGVAPEKTISIDWVAHLVSLYGLPFDVPAIIEQQNFEELVRVSLLAQQMQDEDDLEMLLLA